MTVILSYGGNLVWLFRYVCWRNSKCCRFVLAIRGGFEACRGRIRSPAFWKIQLHNPFCWAFYIAMNYGCNRKRFCRKRHDARLRSNAHADSRPYSERKINASLACRALNRLHVFPNANGRAIKNEICPSRQGIWGKWKIEKLFIENIVIGLFNIRP